MVNMNNYKAPCVYVLTDDAGGHFYVGRTTINEQNRLWEHNYRANNGHIAPVYIAMREVGVNNVRVEVLHRFQEGEDVKAVEAYWIKRLLDEGHPLVNAYGRDGVPDSWGDDRRATGFPTRRGKPTWIKGKTGEEAGWTDERRRRQSERRRSNGKVE